MPSEDEGLRKVVIEDVRPEIDCGRFATKAIAGDQVAVEASIFTDGHDAIAARLEYRRDGEAEWAAAPMESLPNDLWRAGFPAADIGRYCFRVTAWIDRFASWQRDLVKRAAAGQDLRVELLVGADLVEAAAGRATPPDAADLGFVAELLRAGGAGAALRAQSAELAVLIARHPDLSEAVTYDRGLSVNAERQRARYGAWYEMFPRSAAGAPGVHGTFKDVERTLPYVAEMGFDVLYLPPIHPIGVTHRKGKNNAEAAAPGDSGSPWAIGSVEGGHRDVNPRLGTLSDFRDLLKNASAAGIEIAMDIAFQCSPDHPYVREHPQWFRHRPDGTIQYAENPPKKYQDIYPLDFGSDDWRALWEELKGVILYWAEQGVRIFRVDNPHTKPFAFWEWVIAEVRTVYPDAIFLAEAFTRPHVMYQLAKLGFSQSYTYFAWRNTKAEITRYFTELTQEAPRDFFRPNLWPNTPDILTEHLQHGGRPLFVARLVLAATLGASYGIYGPPFELLQGEPREPDSEEYLHSEKYEVRFWDRNAPGSLREIIGLVNRIRKQHAALHRDDSLRFHNVDNEQLIAYSKSSADGVDHIVTVVNLDPHHTQSGWIELDLESLGVDPMRPFQMHDLLSGARYHWQGSRNYVELNPASSPAHIFSVRHRLRSEGDFDYFQ